MKTNRNEYDVLVVGCGLFGSIIAHEATKDGLSVLVLEKRNHIGGNCYTENRSGINVHQYGAHIFRTNDTSVWDYMGRFCRFNNFINSPVANFHGELYNLPFNMNTFYQLWRTATPDEARCRIEKTRIPCPKPENLEEYVLDLVGNDIYQKLVKGYTEKQWGKPCCELPPSIMRRIPLRFTFDNNYFNDVYQGIPIGGYTRIFEQLLEGIEVHLGIDYLEQRKEFEHLAKQIVFTGTVDSYYDYCFGQLEYRSLRFEHEELLSSNYQGVAVMNFTDSETLYTRTIEHKHFEFTSSDSTVVSKEYPQIWTLDIEPYYPLEDDVNLRKYNKYKELASSEKKVYFGGRLGEYAYFDMQDTIKSALKKYSLWFQKGHL